jgi:hypothetical protein
MGLVVKKLVPEWAFIEYGDDSLMALSMDGKIKISIGEHGATFRKFA